MSDPKWNELSAMDLMYARRFLRAYADELRATNSLRPSSEREQAEIVWQVSDGLARMLEDVFAKEKERRAFERIISSEKWDTEG